MAIGCSTYRIDSLLLFRCSHWKLGRISVPIINILAINPRHSDSTNDCDVVANSTLADSTIACDDNKLTESTTTTTQEQQQQQPQMPSLPIRKQFTVVYAKRSRHSANLNKWRYSSVTMHSTDAHVIDVWTRTLQNELNGKKSDVGKYLLSLIMRRQRSKDEGWGRAKSTKIETRIHT